MNVQARRLRRAFAAALAAAALGASAHDTWFEPLPGRGPGDVRLALGTGNRFPVQEVGVAVDALVAQGCRRGNGAAVAMRRLRDAETALQLQARVPRRGPGDAPSVTCWAELQPYEIEIEADKVEVYLDEISASPSLREAWREMQSRGVKWSERYAKHARVELFDGQPAADAELPAAAPVPMAMDIVRDGPHAALHAGDTISFRVLRDGQPLAGFPLELRTERSAFGIWLRTDADGRASVRVPFAGRWCLRGTDLRLSTRERDRWESRFVTLAFEAAPAPR